MYIKIIRSAIEDKLYGKNAPKLTITYTHLVRNRALERFLQFYIKVYRGKFAKCAINK